MMIIERKFGNTNKLKERQRTSCGNVSSTASYIQWKAVGKIYK